MSKSKNEALYIGLDIGTTNIKAVAVDVNGRINTHSACAVELYHLADGGVEQDIELIWQGVLKVLGEVAGSVDPQQIKSIGLSSQGGALQLLDADERPYGKVISWLDGRAKLYNDILTSDFGSSWFSEHTGHPQCNLTSGQMLRLKKEGQLPKNFKIGYVGDVIAQRLCGRRVCDHTSLSLAGLYNPRLQQADSDLLQKLELSHKQLPILQSPFEPAGVLMESSARQTGLPYQIPVSVAVHDQYAAAVGAGVLSPGDVMVGTGTAWVLLAVSKRLIPPVSTSCFVCNHIQSGLFGQIVSMINGGSALSWMLKTLQLSGLSPLELDQRIASISSGDDNPLFVPWLAGPQADGKISGLNLSHSPNHLIRAVVEGLVFELKRHIQMLSSTDFNIHRLIVTGPAATSRATSKLLANICEIPVECVQIPQVSAFGASLLARRLVDKTFRLEKANLPDIKKVCAEAEICYYRQRYHRYIDLIQPRVNS